MKRDLTLIRKMVLAIEDAPAGFAPELQFDDYTDVQVGYHAYLLIDAGLAKGADVTSMGDQSPQAIVSHLTWAGHEFAEASRDEGRWKKAAGQVAAKGGSITLGVLKELLISYMRQQYGLP
jgi:hypothetical protein